MASGYPNSTDAFTTKVDTVTNVLAVHVNDLQNSMVAVQGVLGLNPEGSFATVAAVLDQSAGEKLTSTGALLYASGPNASTPLALGTLGWMLTAGASAPVYIEKIDIAGGSIKDLTDHAIKIDDLAYHGEFAISYAATMAWDVGNNPVVTIGLTASGFLSNPTNMRAGATALLAITQGSTGSFTMGYGTAFQFGADGEPVLSTTGNKKDYLSFYVTGANMDFLGIKKGF